MRVPQAPDVGGVPPPPYTPSASTLTPPLSESTSDLWTQGEMAAQDSEFPTAIDYFCDRPFTRGEVLQNEGVMLNFLTQTIVLLPSSTKDHLAYPEPVETFMNRDVTFKDWRTFKDRLFPQHAVSFASEKNTSTLTPHQQQHVRNVLADWNKGFFRPRRIHFEASFAPPALSADRSAPREIDHALSNFTDGPSLRRSGSVSSIATTTSNLSAASDTSTVSSVSPSEIDSIPSSTVQDHLHAFRATPADQQDPRLTLQMLRAQAQTLTSHHERKCSSQGRQQGLQKPLNKQELRELRHDIRALVRAARQQQREERRNIRRVRRSDRRGDCRHDRDITGVEQPPPFPNARQPSDRQAPPPFPPRNSTIASSSGQSSQQPVKGLWGTAIDTMNNWTRVCEEARDLGEKNVAEVTRRLDVMIERGQRRLRGSSF